MADDDFAKAIKDLNTLALAFDTSGPFVARDLDKLVVATGHLIEGNAKQIVPVDTGALRSSIGTDITREGAGRGYSVTAEVGSPLDYAVYVELGTSRMAPYAYLGPSLDRYGPGFTAAAEVIAIPAALR